MNEDELREALKNLKVEDVLIQTAATLIDLAARRLGLAGEDERKDLDQAKLAIESIRALQPLLTEDQQKAVKEPLSQLQLTFAREAGGAPAAAPEPPEPEEPPKPDPGVRSRIWTPGDA